MEKQIGHAYRRFLHVDLGVYYRCGEGEQAVIKGGPEGYEDWSPSVIVKAGHPR